MKQLVFILLFSPIALFAIDPKHLDKLLATAAGSQSNDYIEARSAILETGTNTLQFIAKAGVDPQLVWQKRLVARICYERITRAKDIRYLLEYDWFSSPPYRGISQQGKKYMGVSGPSSEMSPYVVEKCKELGLWYYYIELTWKKTGECPILKYHSDRKFDQTWPQWCRESLKTQPEKSYLFLAILERVRNDSSLDDAEDYGFYKELLKTKVADAVPVLMAQYDAFIIREVTGLELYPGAKAESYIGLFKPIMSFADLRHADLLETFISEKPALEPLKKRLAEVRARPAPPPQLEPPFRLGTNAVVVAP